MQNFVSIGGGTRRPLTSFTLMKLPYKTFYCVYRSSAFSEQRNVIREQFSLCGVL